MRVLPHCRTHTTSVLYKYVYQCVNGLGHWHIHRNDSSAYTTHTQRLIYECSANFDIWGLFYTIGFNWIGTVSQFFRSISPAIGFAVLCRFIQCRSQILYNFHIYFSILLSLCIDEVNSNPINVCKRIVSRCVACVRLAAVLREHKNIKEKSIDFVSKYDRIVVAIRSDNSTSGCDLIRVDLCASRSSCEQKATNLIRILCDVRWMISNSIIRCHTQRNDESITTKLCVLYLLIYFLSISTTTATKNEDKKC